MGNEEDWAIRDLCADGHVEAVLAHIRDDPSLANRGVGGFTLLQTAASPDTFATGRGEEMIRALVAAGCDPNHPYDFTGRTPLLSALTHNNFPAVECLLELGADPNIGRTVFAAILTKESLPYVKALVRYGVDLNQTFEMSGTGVMLNAIDFAKLQGKEDVVAYLRDLHVEESSGSGDLAAALSNP